MGRVSYSSKWGQVKPVASKGVQGEQRPVEYLVKKMMEDNRAQGGEDYREKALAIYGLICGRCSREFDEKNRQLLTIHHRDGNHNYNPADGSNWEPLCAYCHEDIHSRGLLGDYLAGQGAQEINLAYRDEKDRGSAEGGL
ncbi:MAG: YajD family HNH nuclease, partial [Smithellaceae bacterium]|nr:YajD family HNH nuclease [Smithellaceae bacterium]